MTSQSRATRRATFAVALFSVFTLTWCDAGDFFWNKPKVIDFEFTGRVLDADTNEPIEGAFVLADYRLRESGWGGTLDVCIKTRGMTTGKDGAFHFKIDKLDNGSPAKAYAIKPDYFIDHFADRTPAVQKAQNKETYSNRDIYLKKQDPMKPSFKYGPGKCTQPESKEAAAASIQYLRIELQEMEKYGATATGRAAQREEIESLEKLFDEKKISRD